MSHFATIVALDKRVTADDVHEALAEALAPFDENLEVKPYRDFEEGHPSGYWAVRTLREAGLLPTHDDITWPEVIEAEKKKWPEDREELYFDEELNCAYTVSTRNKQRTWDWWSVGGRWIDHFIVDAKIVEAAAQDLSVYENLDLFFGNPSLMGTRAHADSFTRMDGGRKYLLDLDEMRTQAKKQAMADYEGFHTLTKDFPAPVTWPQFVSQVEAGQLTIEKARAHYHEQPGVAGLRGTKYEMLFGPDPYEFYGLSEEDFTKRAQRQAVPGYALLTKEGEWKEPGRMGWFGMSDDTEGSREAYYAEANDYIDALDAGDWLINVDCHI